jgi:PAS domain S-box-containing protein
MDEFNEITRHLLRFSPDALIVVDDQYRICHANETVTDLFGYSPITLLGRPIEVLIPERWHSRHADHIVEFGKDPRTREMGARKKDLFARRADGSEFSVGIRLAPFHIEDKIFIVAAIRDTTERRQINDDLIAAREKAERADRAKTRFLAVASHDLRQPMQAIGLLNAALLRLSTDPHEQDLLQRQQQSIECMNLMLNALLNITRLESGSVEPKQTDVSLDSIFAQLRSEFETVAEAHNLGFYVEPANTVLHTDRMLFHQLLQNLLSNAFKYTHQGSVSIGCTHDGDVLTITIKDTGVGIPADKLSRIFDDYYQVDTNRDLYSGVGLGLAIVKEVARLLDISVNITSTVGEGTTAHIAIPRCQWASSIAGQCEIVPAPAKNPLTKKPRILLVEDNEGVRVAMELFFNLEGFEVCCARSYAEGEQLLEALRPDDVIVADYHLDENKTGLDLLTRTRHRLGSNIPCVILSGDLQALLRRLEAPVLNTRFLSKPVNTHELITAISELIVDKRE